MADQLRKSLKNTYWPEQEKILTKPSQERERTLCPTFFLAAESVFSIKVICSLQKKNSWRESMKPPSCHILKASRRLYSRVLTPSQLQQRGSDIQKRPYPGSCLRKKSRSNLLEWCYLDAVTVANNLSQSWSRRAS